MKTYYVSGNQRTYSQAVRKDPIYVFVDICPASHSNHRGQGLLNTNDTLGVRMTSYETSKSTEPCSWMVEIKTTGSDFL